ncbi:hypothetical protein ALP55_200016 [Pseudomonas coronafaciens pv. oryzae]|nr:hypothetical protein ALP55_200016 [Pseudomonas coronafaciens pv. oryzae]
MKSARQAASQAAFAGFRQKEMRGGSHYGMSGSKRSALTTRT